MPLTQNHLDNAMLRSENRFAAWQERFDRQWNYPGNQAALASFWRSLNPIVKAQLQKIDPASVAHLEKKFGG